MSARAGLLSHVKLSQICMSMPCVGRQLSPLDTAAWFVQVRSTCRSSRSRHDLALGSGTTSRKSSTGRHVCLFAFALSSLAARREPSGRRGGIPGLRNTHALAPPHIIRSHHSPRVLCVHGTGLSTRRFATSRWIPSKGSMSVVTRQRWTTGDGRSGRGFAAVTWGAHSSS